MSQGWIRLHRRLYDNARSQDPEWLAVWVYLLLHAAHAPYRTLFEGKEVVLQPGQLVTGRKKIAAATGVHESKVFRVLETLKAEQQIRQQAGSKSSLITVVNWGLYQTDEHYRRAASEQQPNTIQELNNIKKGVHKPCSGFPENEQDALSIAANLKISAEFATTVWNEAEAIGGKDRNGQPIMSWSHYLKARWEKHQQWQSQHPAQKRPNHKTVTPNPTGEF